MHTRLLIAIIILATVALLTAGCGSGFLYDNDYRSYNHGGTSPQKTLRIYLNVANGNGNPIKNATIWLDGTAHNSKTDDQYQKLSDNFPPGWRGWKYNWRSGPLEFDLNASGGEKVLEIIVSKVGWASQRTTITLKRYDPDDAYMRQTFVMARSDDPPATPKNAPLPPEVISSAQLAQ